MTARSHAGSRRSLRRALVITIGIAAMAGAATVPAIAVPVDDAVSGSGVASSPLTLAVSPTRLELISGAQDGGQAISIRATGGTAGSVTVEVRDAVIDDTGGWRLTTAGSTPNGLRDALTIEPASFAYGPGPSPSEFRPIVSLVSAALDRPRFGALVVTFAPARGPGEGQVNVQGAVAIQVVAARSARELDRTTRASSTAGLRLALDDLTMHQDHPWTLIDSIVPDIPRLIGSGPATIHVHGVNTGNTVLDTRVVYRIHRRSPLSLLPFVGSGRQPTSVIRQRPRFLIGKQEFTDDVSTRQRVRGVTTSDALPFVGLVQVEATLTGSIAGLHAPPATRTQTFLVLPWAEILVLVAVFAGWRWWRGRRRKRRNDARRGTPSNPAGAS